MTTALLIGAIVPAVGAIVVRWKFPRVVEVVEES